MRSFLTTLAIALIVILMAAWLAPIFIDWSSWRGPIEAELSRRMGAQVRTSGTFEVRLLPIPYVDVERLEIGPAGAFVVDGARFEMAAMALASGQLRFSEIDLTRPQTTVPLGESDAVPWLKEDLRKLLARVAVDRLVVRRGKATLTRPGQAPLVVDGLDFDASAVTLDGPFRGSGAANLTGYGRATFEFAASAFENGALPLKAEVTLAEAGVRADLDGAFAAEPAGTGWRPRYSGAASLSGTLAEIDISGPSRWKASGQLTIDPKAANFNNLSLSLGPDARALEAVGSLAATFSSAPDLSVELTAKQLNVDALLRDPKEQAAPPARAAALLAAIGSEIAARNAPPFRAKLSFATPALFLGAATMEKVSLSAQSEPGKPVAVSLSTSLPGSGNLQLDGVFDFGAAPEFRGRMAADVGDIGALGQWAAHGEETLSRHAQALAEALPYARMSARGDLQASKVGFSIKNFALALDRTKLNGAVAFSAADAATRGRLFLDLNTDLLDLEEAPDVASGAFWIGDFDLTLSLAASRLRIAHAGQAEVDSGSMRLKATRDRDTLALDELSIRDLGGASVEAQGQITPMSRWARVKLDAEQLGDFALLASRVAPGEASRLLLTRAASLSPAHATFEARREGEMKPGPFPFDFVTAEGLAGGTRFTLKANNAPAPVSALGLDLNLEAADGGQLLAELGLRPPAGPLGRAVAALNASGDFKNGFDGKLAASLAGADIKASGRFLPEPPDANAATLFGTASLKSDNLLPALAALRLARAPSGLAVPADLDADIVVRNETIAAPSISGVLAGAKLTGALTWTPPAPTLDLSAAAQQDVAAAQAITGDKPPAGGLTGELSFDKAPLDALMQLAFGPPGSRKANARWSDAKFADPLLIAPLSELKLKIGALDLGDLGAARGAEATLRLEPQKFELADVGADLLGARLSGHASLRRDGATAALSGALDLGPLNVDKAILKAKVALATDFASSGSSPAALIAGLVGQGRLTLSGASLPKLDPDALGRVLAKADGADALIDETNIQHALSLELDKAPLALPDATAPLALTSGTLRGGPIDISGPQRSARVNGRYDLKTGDAEANVQFSSTKTGKFWSGPAPAFTVALTGSPDQPQRRIDDAGLVAGLAAQAIAREADRIAALEADIRERAFFNRRMKAEEFLARRDREIAAYLEEQKRLHFEAERRRVEDAAMKAYLAKQAEEARKAAEAKAEEERRAAVAAAAAKAEEERRAAAVAAAAKAAEEQRAAAAAAAKAAEDQRAAEAKKAEDEKRRAAAAAAAAADKPTTLPTPPPLPPPLDGPPSPAAGGLY